MLDIELRRRPGQLIARIERTFGPPLQIKLTPRHDGTPSAVMVDDVMVGSARAQFQVRDQHDVIFFY